MSDEPRVALVHPPPHGDVPFRHLGLACLQAALERAGLEAATLDLSTEDRLAGLDVYADIIDHLSQRVGAMGDGVDPRLLFEVAFPERFAALPALASRILARVEAHLPRARAAGGLFLLSLNALTTPFAAAMARRLRDEGALTVAGGPATRFAPLRRLLLRAGLFDAVVEGEADAVVVPLVRALAAGDRRPLPGVSRVAPDGEIVETPPGPLVDLDDLPPPSFRGAPVARFVPIHASRGCPHRCAFCSEPTHWPRHRVRDAGRVVADMREAAARAGVRDVHFHDDTINGDLRWLDRFTAALTAGGGDGGGLRWESFASPYGLDAARLARLRASGCVLLKLGVQSFAPAVLRRMRRGVAAGFLRQVVVEAARAGIEMHFDMLTCFPGETDEDHRASLVAIEEIFAAAPQVHFSPNPFYLSHGSQTMLEPARFGLRVVCFDPATLPEPFAGWLRASGSFPVAFAGGVPRETVLARLGDLGRLLERHGRDYQYLGKGAGG